MGRWIMGALVAAATLMGSGSMVPHALGQNAKVPPEVNATSVFVMNADTGQVLYAKNPDKVFRLLSLTKLVTAYILVDRLDDRLSETVIIEGPHLTGGSTAGLKRGDVWTLQDLLYGMVLVSGNDASLAIADYVGRDLLAKENTRGDARERFLAEMQSAAKALGAGHTNFADPYGLAPANVATARDIGLIAARVFTDPRLLSAWACAKRTLQIGGPQARAVTLNTTLEILGEGRVIGAKTGTHRSKKIYNLVTAWRAPNGQTIVGVVMGATSNSARYNQMRALMATVPKDYPELAQPAIGAPAPQDTCR